ncbi:MAG: GAF domain-containing sensor histidine kinase, partial [Chloroflexi bacterium]|nr:GAF domain-containing sensor histidine kinase [Chloroflexota bacterium]
ADNPSEALNSLAASVNRSFNLEGILGDALGQTLETIGMEYGAAYRLESGECGPGDGRPEPCLNPLVYWGLSDEFVERAGVSLLRASPASVAAGTGQPFIWQLDGSSQQFEMADALFREGVRQLVAVPLVAKASLVGALYLATATPRTFSPEQLSLLSAIGQQVGVAVENARLYKAEQERREEAERRRQVAEALREILAVLNSTRSLEDILTHIAGQARRLLGSDAIALFRLDEESQTLRISASEGLSAELASNVVVPLGKGAVGRAALERRPVILDDPASLLAELAAFPIDSRARPDVEHMLAVFKTLVGIPLILKSEVYGAIALYYSGSRQFSEEESMLAVTFADQAALAIENARLRSRGERGAALAERSRLARDLHDSVTQSLYSVTLYAEAAARLLSTGDHVQAASHLRELRDTAQEALREMRLLIFELRPLALDKTGLAEALQNRLDSVELRGGIKAELHVEGKERLTPRLQEELYHIAQEALNNALKHSGAARVRINLRFLEQAVELEVCDEGTGFELEQSVHGGGLGVNGMKERAQKIGGALEIDSAPGKGTRVAIRVPVSNA